MKNSIEKDMEESLLEKQSSLFKTDLKKDNLPKTIYCEIFDYEQLSVEITQDETVLFRCEGLNDLVTFEMEKQKAIDFAKNIILNL